MNRPAPVFAFAADRSRKAARLSAEVRRLNKALAIANARADHEHAARLDAEARCRRATDSLDFLVAGRFERIAKGSEGPA